MYTTQGPLAQTLQEGREGDCSNALAGDVANVLLLIFTHSTPQLLDAIHNDGVLHVRDVEALLEEVVLAACHHCHLVQVVQTDSDRKSQVLVNDTEGRLFALAVQEAHRDAWVVVGSLGPEELGAEHRHATLVWDGLEDHIGAL